MTFEEAMKLTETINCDGVYSDTALQGLWGAVNSAPPVGNFVEIGCEYGRSTSLLAQIAKERNQYIVLVDPFVKHLGGTPGDIVAIRLVGMLVELNVDFALLRGQSARVPYNFGPIALLHIDGNHSEAFLLSDMLRFIPYVVHGGYVCFHDYNQEGPYTEDVKRVVDAAMFSGFKDVGLFDTCKVFQREGIYAQYYEKGRP